MSDLVAQIEEMKRENVLHCQRKIVGKESWIKTGSVQRDKEGRIRSFEILKDMQICGIWVKKGMVYLDEEGKLEKIRLAKSQKVQGNDFLINTVLVFNNGGLKQAILAQDQELGGVDFFRDSVLNFVPLDKYEIWRGNHLTGGKLILPESRFIFGVNFPRGTEFDLDNRGKPIKIVAKKGSTLLGVYIKEDMDVSIEQYACYRWLRFHKTGEKKLISAKRFWGAAYFGLEVATPPPSNGALVGINASVDFAYDAFLLADYRIALSPFLNASYGLAGGGLSLNAGMRFLLRIQTQATLVSGTGYTLTGSDGSSVNIMTSSSRRSSIPVGGFFVEAGFGGRFFEAQMPVERALFNGNFHFKAGVLFGDSSFYLTIAAIGNIALNPFPSKHSFSLNAGVWF